MLSIDVMQKQKAFTLIELMVTVAIIGILASIAIPNYQDSVRKSRRADAKAALLGLANAMERRFTERNSYCDSADPSGTDTGCGTSAEDTGAPTIYTVAAQTQTYYTITISAATASSYTLSATPTGPQSGDVCGTYTLTQTGAKAVDGTATNCW
jgi:type IV pilus assembly protein PilE